MTFDFPEYTGFQTENGTVRVVDIRSLEGVPKNVLQGTPIPPVYLNQLPDEKVSYAKKTELERIGNLLNR